MINKLLCVLAASLASLAFACEEGNKEELLKMQQLWNSQESDHYSYVVEKQCFCSPNYTREMLVLVVNNEVVEAKYLDTNEQVSNEIVDQLVTIPEWFNEISLATENESGDVKVLYDNEFGYPANISIDKHKLRSDDEFKVIISKLTKL
jgi:hypothetical protein